MAFHVKVQIKVQIKDKMRILSRREYTNRWRLPSAFFRLERIENARRNLILDNVRSKRAYSLYLIFEIPEYTFYVLLPAPGACLQVKTSWVPVVLLYVLCIVVLLYCCICITRKRGAFGFVPAFPRIFPRCRRAAVDAVVQRDAMFA